MFCPKCGNSMEEGAVFCTKCGTRVDGVPSGNQPSMGGNQGYQGQQPQYGPAQGQPYQTSQSSTNPWQYFVSALKKYVVLTGRARRAEFWWLMLFYEIFYKM